MKQTFLFRLLDPRDGNGGGDNDTQQVIRDSAVAEEQGEESVDDTEITDENVTDEEVIEEDIAEENASEIADDDEA